MEKKRDGFIVRIPIRDERGNVVGEVEAITYRGLLSLAHDEGLHVVRTQLVQVPREDNNYTAVARAQVRTRKGTFSGIGDASPANVNRRIAPHVIRMAETRAIARALRVAVNIGAVCVDELAEDASASSVETGAPALHAPMANGTSPDKSGVPLPAGRGRDPRPQHAEPGDRRAMSEAQRSLLFRLAFQLGESRETATARVLHALGVERVEYATRVAAARAIDGMRAEVEGMRAERGGVNGEASHA